MFFSVVTITKNDPIGLNETLLSIKRQDYKDIEVIIIDGGKDFESWDICKKYTDLSIKFLCQTNTGIYQAMNLGLGLATGQWLSFLNSGDKFYDSASLLNIYKCTERAEVIVADAMITFGNAHAVRSPTINDQGLLKVLPSHSAFFIKDSVYKYYLYDDNMKYQSDVDYIQRVVSGRKLMVSNEIITSFSLGGVSSYYPSTYVLRGMIKDCTCVNLSSVRCVVIHTTKFMFQRLLGRTLYLHLLILKFKIRYLIK